MTNGRSLELYFIEGKPEGMQTAEVFNWTGHVLMTPRTRIAAALKRAEATYTGVYILIGEKGGEPLAYIGESENIADRIRNHDQKKDWWTTAVIVTTGANNLNKAHVKYLESRLVEIARDIRRTPLENGNTPPRSSLSEAAQANMEAFLDYLLMVLPALRIDTFLKRTKTAYGEDAAPADRDARGDEARFELVNKRHGLRAVASVADGDFVVEAGSLARLNWEGVGSEDTSYAQLFRELKTTGVLEERGTHCAFVKSYGFKSTSAAAAVVNGRPANGTIEWKQVGTGKTYKTWEAEQLADLDGPGLFARASEASA